MFLLFYMILYTHEVILGKTASQMIMSAGHVHDAVISLVW